MKKRLLTLLCFITAFGFLNDLKAQVIFTVDEPAAVQGSYNFTYPDATAGWGVDMLTYPMVTDTLMLVDDGTAGDSLGCNALVNSLASKIAVVYRGSCEFGAKALNAQNAGAVAVIVINNTSGLINMGAGASGANVTIPVINISQADGAALRSYIDAGVAVATIGNKTGVFPNDLVMTAGDVVMSRSSALPKSFADGNLVINTGAWVYNFGYDAQTNVKVKAVVTKDGSTLYADSLSAATLNSADSVELVLTPFSLASYDTGYYNLTYTVSSDSVDSYAGDNVVTTIFYINNNSLYAKAKIDSTTNLPIASSYATAADFSSELKWCIALNEPDASGVKATGITFATSTQGTKSLAGVQVDVQLNLWDDPAADAVTTVYEVETVNYIYAADLQKEFITVPFSNPIALDPNQKYLACIITYSDSVLVGYNNDYDYTSTINNNQEWYFPLLLNNETDWGVSAFGPDLIPAIALNLEANPLSIEEQANNLHGTPYPVPASDFVSVPMHGSKSGKVEVGVYDVTGRLVKSEVLNITSTLKINTQDISNGTYFFKLKFEDMSVSSFPVVISK